MLCTKGGIVGYAGNAVSTRAEVHTGIVVYTGVVGLGHRGTVPWARKSNIDR